MRNKSIDTKQLIIQIDTVVQFGLQSLEHLTDKEKILENALVNIYHTYTTIQEDLNNDTSEYPCFKKSMFPDVLENIKLNFPSFGFYNVVLDMYEFINTENNVGLGDAVDDLYDIIYDLLAVKWRLENNSLQNGLYHFKFVFTHHTKQHLIDLLNYIHQKEY